MNILISSSSPFNGGSGISSYARSIAMAFFNKGDRVYVLSPPCEEGKDVDQRFEYCELPISTEPEKAIAVIDKFCRSNAIDAIINNDNAFLQSYAQVSLVPFVSVIHMRSSSVLSLACSNTEWVDYIVAISNDIRDVASSKFSISATKLPVVYNGVNVPKEVLPFSDCPKVIFTGGENKKKGADFILESFQRNPQFWEGVDFFWFGAVSDNFKSRVVSSKSDVSFYGRVSQKELFGFYRPGDVFLLPSRLEGCPMALLEAMSFGLIPVTSNGYGAMDHLVTNGVEGFVCAIDEFSNDVVNCIDYIFSNPTTRLQMSRKSRDTVAKKFTAAGTVEMLSELLLRPVIPRKDMAKDISLFKWHRPISVSSNKAPLFDRLCIRLGFLRYHSKVFRFKRL